MGLKFLPIKSNPTQLKTSPIKVKSLAAIQTTQALVGLGANFNKKLISLFGCNSFNSINLFKQAWLTKLPVLYVLERGRDLIRNKNKLIRLNRIWASKYDLYTAFRWKKMLPLHGQRTHTNAKNARKLNR